MTYAAMLLKFTYYVQYYFRKAVLLECIYDKYTRIFMSAIMLYYTMTVLLEYNDYCTTIFHKRINVYFISYYAAIMLNAFNDALCSKLCWHNRRVSTIGN